MTLTRPIVWAAGTFFLLATAIGLHATAQTSNSGEDQKIVGTINTVFAALHDEKPAALQSVVTPDFYIFDNGVRFDVQSVMGVIQHLHSAGKRIEWSVTSPDIHIAGNVAWIAYTNKGSITSSGQTAGQEWLECAFLQKTSGVWKVEFMESARVPPPPPSASHTEKR